MKNVHKPPLHPFPRILLGLLIYLFLSNAHIIINMLSLDFDRYERLAYRTSSAALIAVNNLSDQLISKAPLNTSLNDGNVANLQRRISKVRLSMRIKDVPVRIQTPEIELAETKLIDFEFPESVAKNSVTLEIKEPSDALLNTQGLDLEKADFKKIDLKTIGQKVVADEKIHVPTREIKVTDTKVKEINLKEINLKEIYLHDMYLKALDRQHNQEKFVSQNRGALELVQKGLIFESMQLSIFQDSIKSDISLTFAESKKDQPHVRSVLSLKPQVKPQINPPEAIAQSYSLNKGDENIELEKSKRSLRIYASGSQKLSSLMPNAVYNIVTGLEVQTVKAQAVKRGQLNEPLAEKLKLPTVVKQILIEEPKAVKQGKKSVSNIIMPIVKREIAQENEVFNTEPSTSIRGEMKLLRGSGGEITGCKISHITIDADWCTGSNNKDGASCSVLYKNGRVLSVRCK